MDCHSSGSRIDLWRERRSRQRKRKPFVVPAGVPHSTMFDHVFGSSVSTRKSVTAVTFASGHVQWLFVDVEVCCATDTTTRPALQQDVRRTQRNRNAKPAWDSSMKLEVSRARACLPGGGSGRPDGGFHAQGKARCGRGKSFFQQSNQTSGPATGDDHA